MWPIHAEGGSSGEGPVQVLAKTVVDCSGATETAAYTDQIVVPFLGSVSLSALATWTSHDTEIGRAHV